MNSISFRLVSFLLNLLALTVVSNTMSARAETGRTDLSLKPSEPAAMSLREVEPAAIPVATSQLQENHSTISVEPLKPIAVSLRAVEPSATPAVTTDSLENHSTVSVELPKLSKVSLQAVKPAATPAVTSQPLENHSTISVEPPKPMAASIRAVEPTATPTVTSQPLENHFTVSGEIQKPTTAPVEIVEPAVTPLTKVEPLAVNPSFSYVPENMTGQSNVQQAPLADTNKSQAEAQRPQAEVRRNDQQISSKPADTPLPAKPMPGSVATSAALLTAPLQTSPQPKTSSNQKESTIAQTEIQPGQATRGGRSYIGIGGNIGFGDTGLGSGAFAINSKIGLTRFLSVRPAILFGDDVNFLIPLTYDFTIESDDPFAPVPFAPFVGGGVVLSTADNNNIGFLLTGGVDVPLSREFVANATLNIGFLEDSTDVGLMVGVGYTFPNFIR